MVIDISDAHGEYLEDQARYFVEFDNMTKTEKWLFCTILGDYADLVSGDLFSDIEILINGINVTWPVIQQLARRIDKWVKDSHLEGERDGTIAAIHVIQGSVGRIFADAVNKESE